MSTARGRCRRAPLGKRSLEATNQIGTRGKRDTADSLKHTSRRRGPSKGCESQKLPDALAYSQSRRRNITYNTATRVMITTLLVTNPATVLIPGSVTFWP